MYRSGIKCLWKYDGLRRDLVGTIGWLRNHSEQGGTQFLMELKHVLVFPLAVPNFRLVAYPK